MSERLTAATNLGMDHSETESHGESFTELHSGKQVAAAVGITDELTGDEYVALREAYQRGRSDYW